MLCKGGSFLYNDDVGGCFHIFLIKTSIRSLEYIKI